METCWDDDGDARLTSQCVEHRIKKLINSPIDNTFDSRILEQLKKKSNEISTDSSVSFHSALIIGSWDDTSSSKKDCSSVNSL